MPSSRGVNNAGMSVWAFIVLGAIAQVTTPAGLTRAVAMTGVVARVIALVIPLRLLREDEDREAWLWGIALSATNPTLVHLERKIWAQSIQAQMLVRYAKGEAMEKTLDWAARELEGFKRT